MNFWFIIYCPFGEHCANYFNVLWDYCSASIRIDDGEVLVGEIPRKQLRLVQAWIELNREALMADWEIALNGETPFKINPL